jgi:hypothetical protein
MSFRERLVEASCSAVTSAGAGDIVEAYRSALRMISLIHEIEFHEGTPVGLNWVMDEVMREERLRSFRRAL